VKQRNRDLPPPAAASTSQEYDALAEDAVRRIMDFLEDKTIVTVTDYMEPALREHMDWTPRGWMKTEKELLIFEQCPIRRISSNRSQKCDLAPAGDNIRWVADQLGRAVQRSSEVVSCDSRKNQSSFE